MKTIYLVMRNDYKTEPIIAFDIEEDAKNFMAVFNETCGRKFEIFEVFILNEQNSYINPVHFYQLQSEVRVLKKKVLENTRF